MDMITKRIQRRNENILRYRKKGYTYRAIAGIFHLSHTQVMNIIKDYEAKGKELVEAK